MPTEKKDGIHYLMSDLSRISVINYLDNDDVRWNFDKANLEFSVELQCLIKNYRDWIGNVVKILSIFFKIWSLNDF